MDRASLVLRGAFGFPATQLANLESAIHISKESIQFYEVTGGIQDLNNNLGRMALRNESHN